MSTERDLAYLPLHLWQESDVYVLSPKWHLRPNNGEGLVYAFTLDDSKQLFVSAIEAVAIALCDGNNRLDEVISLLSEIVTLSRREARQIVQKLMERNEKSGPFLCLLSEAKSGYTRVNTARIMRELSSSAHIQTETRRLDIPLSLLLQPTYICETDCIYCYAERPKLPPDSYMKPSRWIEIIKEAGELGVDLISFGGGDPLTYPGIEQLLITASSYHMKYLLPTKTLVTASRARELAEILSPWGQVQVSIDSFDSTTADYMTGTKNYAARARTSINNLIAAGLNVQTNTVVTPINIAGIEQLVLELRQLGVSRANITNYARSHHRHNNDLFLSLSQMDHLNNTVNRLKRELQWPELTCNASSRDFSRPGNNDIVAWTNRASCSGGFSSCTILPNGDIVLCEQIPHQPQFVVGNIARQSLLEIWNSECVKQFITPSQQLFAGTACENCDEFDICHRIYGRCFRDAYFNYANIYAPSPNCPRASPGLRMS